MKTKTLALSLVAAVTLGGAASAQSLRIERHDNMLGDTVRSERVERTHRMEVREPRTTSSTVVRGKSAMAPGQRKKILGVQTGREAMELDSRPTTTRRTGSSVTIHTR